MKHTAEAHLEASFAAAVERAKVGAKGEAHFNLLGDTDEQWAEVEEPAPLNREQRRAAAKKKRG